MKIHFTIAALAMTLTAISHAENQPIITNDSSICIIEDIPAADQYKIVKRVKVAKGIYGGFEEIKPKLAAQTRKLGANVVINYHQSQRFGFWPWRVVRPVLWGTAVKWNTPVDCNALGGKEIH